MKNVFFFTLLSNTTAHSQAFSNTANLTAQTSSNFISQPMKPMYLTLLFLLVISCRDESETDGQRVANRIKAEIGSSVIEQVSVRNMHDGTQFHMGTVYQFTADGFIIVTDELGTALSFNLGELKTYQIYSNRLTLFF